MLPSMENEVEFGKTSPYVSLIVSVQPCVMNHWLKFHEDLASSHHHTLKPPTPLLLPTLLLTKL